jgi:hypothetical protein
MNIKEKGHGCANATRACLFFGLRRGAILRAVLNGLRKLPQILSHRFVFSRNPGAGLKSV